MDARRRAGSKHRLQTWPGFVPKCRPRCILRRVKGLYPIVDLDACRARQLDPRFVTEALLAVEPPLLQLRAKNEASGATLKLLREMQTMVASTPTVLVANDRPDLALLAHCGGVHLGQEDIPVRDVRKLGRPLLIGVSTHDARQVRDALFDEPDYVAFGPVYTTRSKRNPDATVSLDELSDAHVACRGAGVPLVAIGGITDDNLEPLFGKVELVAVISALLHERRDVIVERAKRLHDRVGAA